MHNFSDLAYRSTIFTLDSLKNVEEKAIEGSKTSEETSLVKTLQMIRLKRIILAVGTFSIFEALLQDRLNCENGFLEAKNILKKTGALQLLAQFTNLELAINALKHGRGRSYNTLIGINGEIKTFKIKEPKEHFFDEGDVSEITTLINVEDKFIYNCVEVISQVSESIKKFRPDVIL